MKTKNIVAMLLLGVFCISASAQSIKTRKEFDALQQKLSQPFDEYVKNVNREYEEFRDSVNRAFADYMEKGGWTRTPIMEGEQNPKIKELPPVTYDKTKEKPVAPKTEPRKAPESEPVKGTDVPAIPNVDVLPVEIIPSVVIPMDTVVRPQPVPAAPIPENDEALGYESFTVFGTPMKFRVGALREFKMEGNDEKAVANAFRTITGRQYNNLIRDCLTNRIEYKLCDWAFYKMLQTLTEAVCGKGTNEARVVQGIILNQTGYSTRFAYDPETHDIFFMVRTSSNPYDHTIAILDNENYYTLEKCKSKYLNIFKTPYPGEQTFSFDLTPLPAFSVTPSNDKKIRSASYSFEATSSVNRNLIDFFNTYPASYCLSDFMTQWAFYANTPISNEVKEKLYPTLKEAIKGADQRRAANVLLNWVQTGFSYETDDVQWGEERSFFAEESLYYPACDCEDRSILMSHLVRDLMGLDVVLVYYPGHLATAVNFTEEVSGDYLMLDNRKFVIADGTYIGAPVGRTMPGMDNKKAKVILLKKEL